MVKEAYSTLVLWSLTQKSLRGGVKIEFDKGKNGGLSIRNDLKFVGLTEDITQDKSWWRSKIKVVDHK